MNDIFERDKTDKADRLCRDGLTKAGTDGGTLVTNQTAER